MSERLSDVAVRIESVRQLSAVVAAMQGIAAAHSREARGQLAGVQSYARTIATAIGQALAYQPAGAQAAPGPSPAGRHAVVAICAEQGFAGLFNERVLDAAERLVAAAPEPVQLLLVGDRGLMAAGTRRLAVAWSAPMMAHVGQATALANQIVEELYRRIDREGVSRISVVHAVPGSTQGVDVRETVLLPFDFARFPPARHAAQPLITLQPDVLLARLAEEYVFAELCEAVTLSFAAENEARLRAMVTAKSNVTRTLADLTAKSRRLRQEEITSEILELAGGQNARS
ncbi:F0F1 ATP synthase subunit gamma [Chelatococcus asaccharovorans]|uniref:F0F1 ATP synthase subunit gamma n=1 Tax=Chelatococcus asaccharovorans TaxID=28210 RepID=UPI00224C6E3A|nr:FoF1 ATP synthase subunit gamma [Chelatococcus asaccharovorans]CAH1663866.1 ATP synthase gamma chain [Chelatococcus asaccharovorans]CAH1682618.1 ATP synthase gamma chain [Chelatococcus asaccharovorans]